MGKVIGIDLGTTNSVVAVLENNRPEVIANSEGGKTTPSVILYELSGEVLVGDLAKRQRVTAPERTIYSVKRFMGCRWDEASDRTQGISYQIAPDTEGMVTIRVGRKKYRPEEVSAHVLKKMKETAEAYLGEPVEHAVITVPAFFNDSQRQATKLAGERAGLNVQRIVNEPTAAALAYGLNKRDKAQKVAVFDFGGGTFDISILDIERDIIEVKSTGGDTYLGGDNINQLLVDWINQKLIEETGIDPKTDLQAVQRILETAEKVKCELSTMPKTLVSLPFIVSDATGPKHLNADITREEFTKMLAPILDKLRPPCIQALADAKIKPKDLTAVILVGGSTRIPAVRELVKELFEREPDTSMNPDEVVAAGASVQGGIMSGELDEVLLLDVTPLSLGIELAGDVFAPIIPRNSNVPATVSRKFTTVVDNQSTVNVHVLQGERKIASHNRTLGNFKLTGIPPAPREIPEVEVKFHIDANGILVVSAMDLTSGVSQKVEIESYVPSGAEVTTMMRDSELAADQDRDFVQKSEYRRRIAAMEALFKEMLSRKDAVGIITEEYERRMREVIFKWEISLSQKDWNIIEDAERDAKSLEIELASMLALGHKSAKSGHDVQIVADPKESLEAAIGQAAGVVEKPKTHHD